MSFDDMQLEQVYEIDGYVKVAPLSFEYKDSFLQYDPDHPGDNAIGGEHVEGRISYDKWDCYSYILQNKSGEKASFAWFAVDITNMQKEPLVFGENCEVKVVFDDEYEFGGWFRQFNYDYDTTREYEGSLGTFIRAAIDPSNKRRLTRFIPATMSSAALCQMRQ